METIPIGVIIKKIVQKNNLSVKDLANKMKLTRQAVYAVYQRTSMHDGEIKRWADALGVTIQELSEPDYSSSNRSTDNGSFGEEILGNIQRMLQEELKEKNEQIKALQEALRESQQMSRVLLGKSRECLDRDVLPMYPNGILLPAEIA